MTDSSVLIRWTCGLDGDDFLTKYVRQPLWNLFNVDNFAGFLIAWGIVIGVFGILFYKAPVFFGNSKDGFIDSNISVLFSLLVYWLFTALLIAVSRPSFCKQKARLANQWRLQTVSPPAWLLPTISELKARNAANPFS